MYMRFLTTSMMALVVAVAITGCSGSSNSADNSATSAAADNSATSSASSDNSAATTAGDQSSAAKATGDIPTYPGAKTEAAGSNAMSGSGMAAGKVLSTTDDFDKVYGWYQKNMPAGSEKSHMDTPVKSAVFMTGEAGKDQQSVTISTNNGKTMITIAHVKM
jgi:ABC-type enterochelin transport system substrate-binding protein